MFYLWLNEYVNWQLWIFWFFGILYRRQQQLCLLQLFPWNNRRLMIWNIIIQKLQILVSRLESNKSHVGRIKGNLGFLFCYGFWLLLLLGLNSFWLLCNLDHPWFLDGVAQSKEFQWNKLHSAHVPRNVLAFFFGILFGLLFNKLFQDRVLLLFGQQTFYGCLVCFGIRVTSSWCCWTWPTLGF
jgi:hypothetical protein